MSTNEERPYSDSHLDSPEYRKRLMRKLNIHDQTTLVKYAIRKGLVSVD